MKSEEEFKMSYLYTSNALIPQDKPASWNHMIIIIIICIRISLILASFCRVPVADFIGLYAEHALKSAKINYLQNINGR